MGELEIFAIRIKQLRESLKMTQKDFSDYIGIKQQTLSGYERGIMKPPLDIAKGIAEKCNISIDWLCGLSERKNSPDNPVTYSDVISLLVNSEYALRFHVTPQSIKISDKIMLRFLDDWSQMLPLYRNGTIDEKLYKLWLDDKKREFENIRLGDKDEIEINLSVETDDE
jgi:transcriptional regulator with XRE-family HTH domain